MRTHAPRLNYQSHAPKAMKAMLAFSQAAVGGTLGPRLAELVKLRVSQINGCAFCIDMHWADLVRQGVEPRHINAVAGWREAPFFSERERAALQWAEAVNAIPARDPSDADFALVRSHLDDGEIAELGWLIGAIRVWNQMNVSLRLPMPPQPFQAG